MSGPTTDFRERLPALDGVRGIAILLVFCFSYGGGAAEKITGGIWKIPASVVGFGWCGVDLFFVLSGFLITGILYDTLDDKHYFRNFYGRRALRILPIYYLLLGIYFALTPVLHVAWKPAHLFFLVYLGFPAALIFPGLVDVSPYVVIAHLWSLSVEEQFYMAWPLGIPWLRRPRPILAFCAVAMAAALVLRIALVATRGPGDAWSYTLVFCRMDGLALGSAIAILYRLGWGERLRRVAPAGFLAGVAVLVAICAARHSVSDGDPAIRTVGFTFVVLTSGCLVVLGVSGADWIRGLLSFGVLRTFGKYSYGMYLYHRPLTVVLAPLREWIVARSHSYVVGSMAFLAAALLLNLGVAAVSYEVYERWFLRWKGRFAYSN